MDELPATHTGAPPELPPGLGAAELEVEAPDLELLVRIRGELDVLLHPVVLVRLDDRQPREVLEEDLRHLAIRVGAELLVYREAGGVAERGGRVAPIEALEALLSVLLGAHRELDDLELNVDPYVLPHRGDGLGH